jgi:aminoglycoside 3-N-acetyltransferase
VDKSPEPITRARIRDDLSALGLQSGDTVLVHSALSKIGWVPGGPVAVVQALMDVLTPSGTLVMPTHTTDNSDPAAWQNPAVPQSWWDTIRDHMPAFDPHITPTRGMGRIVECFRSFPDVIRSDHPQVSFAAWGHHATFITSDHALESDVGEESPLARIYDLDGQVLLLGVPHGNNTSLHLAEYRSDYPGKGFKQQGAALTVNGVREWVSYSAFDTNEEDFDTVGATFEESIGYTPGRIGLAESRLLSQRALVDFAVEWFAEHRR